MKHIYFFSLLIFNFFYLSSANIEGVVLEKTKQKNIPLIGVNIYWENTTMGTISDSNGFFEIEKPNNVNKLVFSFVGYTNDTIIIKDKKPLTVFLNKGAELDEVKVTKRVNSSVYSKITPIYVQKISDKELTRAACCNLSESFETNASVDVSYSDAVSGVKQIKLLGLSGRYSQVTLENIPILRGAESAFGLDYIPGTWMESIQVSKGSAAVKNGYESITGQININYKQPIGDEKLHANIYGNQDGKLESNFGYSFNVREKLSSTILMHSSAHTRNMDMNNDGFLDKPQSQLNTLLNRWSYDSDKFESKFGFSVLTENRDGGQSVNNSANTNPYLIGIDVNKIHLFAKNGFIFNRPSTSLGTIVSYTNFNRDSYYGNNIFNVDQHNFYSNFIYQSYISNTKHTYNTGFSFVYDDYNADFNSNSELLSYNEAVTGVFFEYNYIPNDKLTVLGGIRYDYSSIYNGFITPRFHAKYRPSENSTFRISIGKGYRHTNPVSENSFLLASSKSFIFNENIKQEKAWNYGISLVNSFTIFNRELSVNSEFFYTDFDNQLVVDLDSEVREVNFYNLDGKSYSKTFQIESTYELFKRFALTTAYRYNDVKSTFNNELKRVPFVSNYKGLISASYKTNFDKWQFDFTAQFHGNQRLPTTQGNSIENMRPNISDNYTFLLAQVTKNYKNWSFYLGSENIGNFTQKNAIINPSSPFNEEFDTSRIWGPIFGRMFYAGIKYTLDKD